jgi:hypothetical protein
MHEWIVFSSFRLLWLDTQDETTYIRARWQLPWHATAKGELARHYGTRAWKESFSQFCSE